jgi:hypothetical protein
MSWYVLIRISLADINADPLVESDRQRTTRTPSMFQQLSLGHSRRLSDAQRPRPPAIHVDAETY